MKKSITCLLVALALVTPVLAETVKFPADKPYASITFPDDWEVEVIGDLIMALNEDEEVVINVITTRPDMLGPSNDKAFALLRVKPDFNSFKETKTTVNGMPAVQVTVDGKTASGGTMELTLTSVELTKDKGVMLIIRGDGVPKNQKAIAAILNSVAAAPAVQAAELTKEQAIAHLKGLLTVLEAKDYDKAATFFATPPGATSEQLKAATAKLLELSEISAEGIELLAAEGKWGKLADVVGAQSAASWTKRFGVSPAECWGLIADPGEAAFHFDGTSLKVIRCDDIGKLEKKRK